MGKQLSSPGKGKGRQSNFELLRIIAMLMIIGHHFAYHGLLKDAAGITLSSVWMQFIFMGGKIGVNLFVLISGYFMVNAKQLSVSKVLRVWIQVFLYSVLGYLIMVFYRLVITHDFAFDAQTLIHTLLPISFNQWWFASTYLVLFLFSPFLNMLIRQLDQRAYVRLLLIMFACWSVISTLIHGDFQFNNLLWFVFLYCFAGYLRLYANKPITHKTRFSLLTTGCYLLIFVLKLALIAAQANVDWFDKYIGRFFYMNMVPIFLISVMIFLMFRDMTLPRSGLINGVAALTFGVYLFHDNIQVRALLKRYVYCRIAADRLIIIPYSVLAILVIFAVSAGVEFLRQKLLEKYYMKAVEQLEPGIRRTIGKLTDKFVR